ncbi:MAG: D-alanine--D-alanine ligase [Thermoleophilia bacterium]|nr:D-alanine--D-alanine ligase [Thermoleophilia bacterium]
MTDIILKTSRIGVLMGGLSREREISLRSGAGCLAALQSLGYNAVGIDVDRDVAEKLRGEDVRVAFLALHGKYGEDGNIQGLLEMMDIPYTGSRVLASAIGMNKVRTKQIAVFHKIPTAAFEIFEPGQDLGAVCIKAKESLRFPVMVKPCEEGSSLGVVKISEPEELVDVIMHTCADYGCAIAEEFVEGDEITVGLIENRRTVTALPVLQLKPSSDFYDYEAKYNHGMTEFVVPAEIPDETATHAQELAMHIHAVLSCRGFSRVDFIIDSEGTPQLTEINTLPGMTETSDFPAQAKAANIEYEELVQKMLRTALLP